jgi:nitrate reductase gamma subunit
MRLYILELTGLALGIFATVGISLVILRRTASSRLRVVTSGMDWLLLVILLLQVVTGVFIALVYRWGSSWYLQTAVPWLWSLLSLNPQIQYVTTLPLIAQLHMLSAFLLLALLPFTRLVHLFTVPMSYLWRPYQVVIWNRRKRQSVGEKEV